MENFDKMLGEVIRTITEKKIKCNISLLSDMICFDLYDADVFEIYYSEYIKIGSEFTMKRLLDYIKMLDMDDSYIVEYKTDIFNIKQKFKYLKNAQDFCDEVNNKFNIEIKPEKVSERIKRD